MVSPPSPIVNALTIDVEEYFQVEAFAGVIDRGRWEAYDTRVDVSVDMILGMLAEAGCTATFFVLGWIAARYPAVVRAISGAGHEVASHGFDHRLADTMEPDAFRSDVRATKRLLEDITGLPVAGYRAPCFSINGSNLWALAVLEEEGYRYSSSLYPIRHDLYGMPEAPRFPFHPLAGSRFIEAPLSTVPMFGRNVPCAGGGYFRLFPYRFSRWQLRRINLGEGRACIFYMHPWELDPEQPRPGGLPIRSRLRHYLNLARSRSRLQALLRDFAWSRMDEVLASQAGGPR
ncbi:MAG TPA: XrtA system polysaccharide deacetylase [Planctomycetota bacterium]|nr:XrtA system polysaccharide deacetylase [Planctomycetota bacterium]